MRRASRLLRAEKPSRFGLLSDLTSFVQVGDLLVVDAEKSSLQIVEVKEGPANERIGKFAEFIAEAQCGRAFQYFREEEGDKGVAQLLRIARQADRMSHVAEVVNKGEGIDPDTGEHVHVPKEPLLMASYDQELAGLIESSRATGWAIKIIDGCLFAGAYRNHMQPLGRAALTAWFQHECKRSDFPLVNILDSMRSPLALPLFCRNLGKENIFDLIFGRCSLFLALNLDGYIELSRRSGIPLRWATKKEVARLQLKGPRQKVNTRVMVCNDTSSEFAFSDGIFFRTIFHGETPLSTLPMIQGGVTTGEDGSSP